MPREPGEAARWEHTRLRRRMLDGQWRRDLEVRVQQQVGSVRADAWGPLDLSANPLSVVCTELATLYLAGPPDIKRDSGDTAPLAQAIASSGLWASMSRYQSWVIGCREYLLRVHATEAGELRYRAVAPDMTLAYADPEVPDVPLAVRELRLREVPGKSECRWTWDVLDVRNADAPVYRVLGDDGSDLTAAYLGAEHSGDAYPYRRQDGTPVLPYVLHHAERLGDRLWDWCRGLELVEGSLNLGMLRSFWLHLMKDASWPQRYGVNTRPSGLETKDQHGKIVRQELVTDPATMLVLEAILKDSPVEVGQFQPGGDPVQTMEAIQAYAAWLAHDAGISGSDLLRSSGDPRSGYALSLSNEGKRAAQRRYAPQFRDADERLVALSAVLSNVAAGTSYPEDGYSVVYAQIPLSPEELQARRQHLLELVGAGLMSRVDAYLELHPGLTREQAAAELKRIRAEDGPPPSVQPQSNGQGAQDGG